MADLEIAPGYVTEETPRDARNRWKNGNYVRFGKNAMPMKLGGNIQQVGSAFLGKCRRMYPFVGFNLKKYLAIGTHLRMYIYEDGLQSNITPLDNSTSAPFSDTALSNPFTTTAGSATVTVADTSHGREVGSFVIFSGATVSPVDGILINGAYQVVSVPNANSYTILHSVVATNAEAGFGGTVNFDYELNVGEEYNAVGDGWGGSTWNASTWGTPRTGSGIRLQARTYAIDGWGEDVLFNPRGKGIYIWDTSAGVTQRASLIANAPTTNEFIVVSPEDRHLISLGAHDGINSDPMLVRWCSQEDYDDWTPSPINTAGDKRLDKGNRIVTAIYARKQILILTDTAAYGMNYLGYPEVFGIGHLADKCGGISANCIGATDEEAFWMGANDFYKFDGGVVPIPCDVRDYVFKNINRAQKELITCHVDSGFSEVTWQYPSADSIEVDSWVTYNYYLKCWYFGQWDAGKTVMVNESPAFENVMAAGVSGFLLAMNSGTDENTTAVTAFIESYDFNRSDGGNTMVTRIIPNFLRLSGTMKASLYGKQYPSDPTYKVKGPVVFSPTTKKKNLRMRADLISLRLETTNLGDDFAIGKFQSDFQPVGER